MYACLAVTCHLHFWQYDRDFLRATVVTRGWNGYRSKSQHRKSTLEKKILPPFQQGFEPATFQSRVRRSNHWSIPAPWHVASLTLHFSAWSVRWNCRAMRLSVTFRYNIPRFCNTVRVAWNGGGESLVVRAPDLWLKGLGFESLLERRENFLLHGRLSVLTLISVSVPPPCYRGST